MPNILHRFGDIQVVKKIGEDGRITYQAVHLDPFEPPPPENWNAVMYANPEELREMNILPEPQPNIPVNFDIAHAGLRDYMGGLVNDRADIPAPNPIPPIFRFRKVVDDMEKENRKMFSADSLGYYLGFFKDEPFGIEIEVEGARLPEVDDGGWSSKKDGSLRGESYEYVTNGACSLEEAKKRIQYLNAAFVKHKSVLDFSYRTSVHVHVNALKLNKQGIATFIYISHLVEDILVNYSGEHRVGNRFCLRTKDAEGKLDAIKDFLTRRGFNQLNLEYLKYGAINIAALTNQGTLEFRSMRGTMDEDILFPWLDVLNNIRNMADKLTIKEVTAEVTGDADAFLKKVFGKHLKKFQYEGMKQDLIAAYSLLIELPYLKVV